MPRPVCKQCGREIIGRAVVAHSGAVPPYSEHKYHAQCWRTPPEGRCEMQLVIIVSTGYWAKGSTPSEAQQNARKAGAASKDACVLYRLPEGAVNVAVDSLGIVTWEGTSERATVLYRGPLRGAAKAVN